MPEPTAGPSSVRAALALVAVLVAVLVAGCGGSGETVRVGRGAITVPADVHGVYDELEAILDQLPYQGWYTRCVVGRVKAVLSPAEAEALAELPEARRERKATAIIAKAGPACEGRHHRPVVDPNASSKELDLLRAGYVSSMKGLAESNGLDPKQTACVERGFENLPAKRLIEARNGSAKLREGILLSVFKPCSKVR